MWGPILGSWKLNDLEVLLLVIARRFLAQVNIAAAGGRLIGSLGSILEVLGRGTGPKREEMAGRSRGTNSQDLATILDPFGTIFDDLGPDRLSAT